MATISKQRHWIYRGEGAIYAGDPRWSRWTVFVSPDSFGGINSYGRGYPRLRVSSQTAENQRSYSRRNPGFRISSQTTESKRSVLSQCHCVGMVAQSTCLNDTHAWFAVGGTVIRDVIPCQGRAFAQQPPVLFWPIIDTHDLGFNTTGTRSLVRAALDIGCDVSDAE